MVQRSGSATRPCPCASNEGEPALSELTLVLIRFAYLAILWIFVLSCISVIRSDMFGARVAREPNARGASRQERKAKGRQAKPAKPRKGVPTQVVILEGGNKGETVSLEHAPLLIGRGNDAAIRLDDDYVSTRHARIASSGRPVVRRGPRLHQRHLRRQQPHLPGHGHPARHPGAHRQDHPGAAQVRPRVTAA